MLFLQEMIGASVGGNSKSSNSSTELPQKIPIVTVTRVPFASEAAYPPDPYVIEVISDLKISTEHIRSSAQLKILLATIIKNFNDNSFIKSHNDQVVGVRLDALMKLLVAQLCVPHLMSFMGVGLSLPFMADPAGGGLRPRDSSESLQRPAPQSLEERAAGILVDAFSFLKYSESLLFSRKSDAVLDLNRSALFIDLMKFRCSPLLPQCVTVSEQAPAALELLACHLLSVTAVNSSIRSTIKVVTARLSNVLTDDAGSYSVDERLPQLQRVVLDFFRWLREHAEQLVKLCRREEIVTSVDSSVRAWLRGESYSSPAELLSVYRQKYRAALTHMPIPLQPYKATDVDQAVKDVLRDHIALNKVVYVGGVAAIAQGGAEGEGLVRALRSELRKALAFSFEIDHFGGEGGGGDLLPGGPDLCCEDSDSGSSLNSTNSTQSRDATTTSGATSREAGRRRLRSSRETAAAESGSQPSHLIPRSITTSSHAAADLASVRSTSSSLSFDFRDDWQGDLLDMLHTHALLAASRTFAGGDAFWVLADLYGGDGLALCPLSAERALRSPSATPRHRSRSSSSASSPRSLPDTSSSSSSLSAAVSVAVTSSGAKVTLRESYGLYLVEALERCVDRDRLVPLSRFECTTTTLLVLNPAAPQQPGTEPEVSAGGSEAKLEACYRLYRTLVANPEQVVHRAVTIEPFL